jgi:hypothetical protein
MEDEAEAAEDDPVGAIDIVYSPKYSDQEFTSSIVTFSKKPFE